MFQSTPTLPTVRFSADEDELLIEFVQKHVILYDLKDPEFKNTMKKDLLWNEAGKTLKKEGEFLFIISYNTNTYCLSVASTFLYCLIVLKHVPQCRKSHAGACCFTLKACVGVH